jgi:hypothetical protein
MIILFYSDKCQYCAKLLEYIVKNNLKKYFKMINIDNTNKIPKNITIVPTIIDTSIEAPLEGKYALEYLFNQKYFNHPTNNIEFWINNGVPIPSIEEDKKAIDKYKLSNYACFSDDTKQSDVVIIKNKAIPINEQEPQQHITISDKKTLALLKLRRR